MEKAKIRFACGAFLINVCIKHLFHSCSVYRQLRIFEFTGSACRTDPEKRAWDIGIQVVALSWYSAHLHSDGLSRQLFGMCNKELGGPKHSHSASVALNLSQAPG